MPCPGGCGGSSGLAASTLAASTLAASILAASILGWVFAGSLLLASAALTTTEFDVSGMSARTGGIALVTGGAGCAAPARASFTCPALTCTVLTLTGFIGSDEPGITDIGWFWITPEVSGAGCSTLASALAGGGGMAAAAAAIAASREAAALAARAAGVGAGSVGAEAP